MYNITEVLVELEAHDVPISRIKQISVTPIFIGATERLQGVITHSVTIKFKNKNE